MITNLLQVNLLYDHHLFNACACLEEACLYLYVKCVAIVQSAGVPVQVMWQLERDTSHVPAGLEHPRGVSIGDISGELDGKSRVLA